MLHTRIIISKVSPQHTIYREGVFSSAKIDVLLMEWDRLCCIHPSLLTKGGTMVGITFTLLFTLISYIHVYLQERF